jgi:putative spermidine/putrescine transport system ATP-binding protein
MTELSLDGLTKRFGTLTAVDDVTLDITDGSFVCLLGPSGCGKTTLLRLLAGLEPASAGRVLVAGRDITDTPTHRRDFGMVFQSLALFPHLTVWQNVAYPLKIRGRPRAECRKRADELLDLVQLSGVADRRIHQLSGGQRQRVAIARGLAIDPQVFLLDEPLSALDANLREHMQVELRQLQQRLGVTTVVVTHDQKEALTMADTVIVMQEGRVQQVGTPMEVYRDPANAFVAGFIGTSNLMPCTLHDDRTLALSGQTVTLDPEDRVKAAPGPAVLSVRPEDVRLGDAGDGLPARVAFIRDLGESVQFVLDHDGQTITALFSPQARPAATLGDRVGVCFAPGGRVVLPA